MFDRAGLGIRNRARVYSAGLRLSMCSRSHGPNAGVSALLCVLHIPRAVTLVVYLFFVCVSRFLWCETGNTLQVVANARQGVSSWLGGT
nr:MAG TPA: hypothetical protein [Caudoviricetes sp.]